MSNTKQGVNLDFVFGPDLEQTTATTSTSGPGIASTHARNKSSAYEQSDSAYGLSCVCIVICSIVTFNMAAASLLLENLVINQRATYMFFVSNDEMLLQLPSNRVIIEFIMFESLVAAWALLMQYKAMVLLSAFTCGTSYYLAYSNMYAMEHLMHNDMQWISLLIKPLLCLRLCCTLTHWLGKL
ncbi:hypothetical protein BOX15_Mlig022580g2 [Macrostomum lignano]|uniref:Uncharacterized protein n=1 Tax=Macrostomum lignano TaxID=282301 RepID=A0A267H3A1_9PLAT|nr:hypothetical protein BOX15_Mlig022580g2 [Macrostomum lignano]